MSERAVTQFRFVYRVTTDPALGEVELDYHDPAVSTIREALTDLEGTRGALPVGAVVIRAEITGRRAFVKDAVR